MRNHVERAACLQGRHRVTLSHTDVLRMTRDDFMIWNDYLRNERIKMRERGYRQCPTCEEWLVATLDNFYGNVARVGPRNPNGLAGECKSCHRERMRQYRALDKIA